MVDCGAADGKTPGRALAIGGSELLHSGSIVKAPMVGVAWRAVPGSGCLRQAVCLEAAPVVRFGDR
jgi:hypothetical protein